MAGARFSFTVGGRRTDDPDAFADEVREAVTEAVERFLGEVEEDLHGNTGAIWPYATGASSEGFEVVGSEDEWGFLNDEEYAVYVEAEGGYVERIVDERNNEFEGALEDAVRDI